MPEGEVRVDDAKIMPPRRGEMKVRVWECGERGWVRVDVSKIMPSRRGEMKIRVWKEGRNVGEGGGEATPRH